MKIKLSRIFSPSWKTFILKTISICGDLAADLDMTEQFLQMGIDELSVAPNQVLALRKKIREIQ